MFANRQRKDGRSWLGWSRQSKTMSCHIALADESVHTLDIDVCIFFLTHLYKPV